jgi:hypothetical protein
MKKLGGFRGTFFSLRLNSLINDIVDGNVITSSLVDFMSFFMNNTIVDGNGFTFSLS